MRLLVAPLCLIAVVITARPARAGGSGLNVIVVVNQNSTNSLQLGNDYCEARGVPPQNVFRMTGWTGSAITWSRTDLETQLRNPLLAMLADRGLTNQAEFVLLSMDIPYRVVDGDSQNGTTSALFYGFKTNTPPPAGLPVTCSLPNASSNSYAFGELPFRQAPPNTAPTNSFLAMMLTDTTLAGAELILNRGVAGDSSFPTQTVVLARTSDGNRSVRDVEFDNALLDSRVRGDNSLIRMDTDSTSFTNLLGLLTGLATLSLPSNAFVSGTMGDSLTSYGGDIFDNSSQTTLLAFLDAGAAGSYGTVVEPCNYVQKFPDPMDYFYQNRGFSVAEAYYQSVRNPYQGLLVGEPLSAPFAQRGAADWSSLTNGSALSGQPALGLTFFAAATNLPLGQVDLFLDGSYLKTVTNLPPATGNLLSVAVNGFPVNYAVPANATVASTARGLAAALTSHSSSSRVSADAAGDRIILRSLDLPNPENDVTLSASTAAGSAPQLTTLPTAAQPAFLDSAATGYLGLLVRHAPAAGAWLRLNLLKTTGRATIVSVTNTTAGTTIGAFVQSLVHRVNSTAALQAADGVLASDFYASTSTAAAGFTLYARSPGYAAAQIQVTLTASSGLLVLPAGTNPLEDNLSDLQSRNHLYVASGALFLPVNFVLDTTHLPDGYHELTAVAYEGTSVRTQTRVTRAVRIQNTSLAATLTPLFAGTNVPLEGPLQFAVAANATNISLIELFSTGGSVGAVSNQPAAVFSVASPSLGLGLHPFYALVTDTSGNRFRTETAWIHLIAPLQLSLTGPPLTLIWPAISGRQYDILATTNLSAAFQPVASVIASASLAQWPVSAAGGPAGFYQVRLAQ